MTVAFECTSHDAYACTMQCPVSRDEELEYDPEAGALCPYCGDPVRVKIDPLGGPQRTEQSPARDR